MRIHRNRAADFEGKAGFTLLEVTLVVTVVLGLIIILYVQLKAYKDGSDRATCIQNIATVQRAVRSFGNLHEIFPGDTSPGMQSSFIGVGKFLDGDPKCPADGTYTYMGDVMPPAGVLYLDCSIADHVPQTTAGW